MKDCANTKGNGNPEQAANSTREAEYRTKLRHNTTIPSMPAAALRAIEIGNNPESGIADVVAVIQCDVALSAKILMAANSPIYGMRRRVSNLSQAASIMGLDACMVLILSFSLAGSLGRKSKQGIDHRHFWLRSLACAVAGRSLASHGAMANTEQVFLASLLQDIGIFAFDRLEYERYAPAYQRATSHAMLVKMEQVAFGLDHSRLGQWLLAEWHFPEWMIEAIGTSHGKGEDRLQRYVSAASMFAEVLIAADKDNAIHNACSHAQDTLGMDEATLLAALETMQQAMPEYAEMFDVEYHCSEQDLVEQARQTLMLRSMRLCSDIVQTRQQATAFEAQVRQLEDKASRDMLTGAFNRAYLDNHLAEAFVQASEQNWPLSIAFIDLDHFKQVNDHYGHQFGDTVLEGVAQGLMNRIRQSDVLGRYGGEEFVLAMSGADTAAAVRTLNRLLEGIRALKFTAENGEAVEITFSAGVATHMDNRQYDSVRDLVRAADDALYAAKGGGRNRVVYLPEN